MFTTNPGCNTLQNSSCKATYLPSYKPSQKIELDMLGTAGEVRRTFSFGLLYMGTPVLAEQQKIIWINLVQTLDAV